MKPLVNLAPPDMPMLWFGAHYPCDDSYHSGYESERAGYDAHSSCAQTLFNTQGVLVQTNDDLEYIRASMCGCRRGNCRNYPRDRHYVLTPESENLFLANDGSELDVPTCRACRDGNHPTRPDATSNREH